MGQLFNNNVLTKEKELVLFLRNIADSIENDQLNDNQLSQAAEFFISYQFQEQVNSPTPDFDEKDLNKFLSFGWYVYNLLQQNQTSTVDSIENSC